MSLLLDQKLRQNNMYQVGQRVWGKYGNTEYTGTIAHITDKECLVYCDDGHCDSSDWNDKPTWTCTRRSNGHFACASGVDDGKYELKTLSPTFKHQKHICCLLKKYAK